MDVEREARDPMEGRLLDGRYRVGSRVARGGMAAVYEALDTRLDRVVAVKIMHSGLGDDHDFAARFVREARAAARLTHPHVVGVYDQGDDDGTVFLVMEYLPGHTLRDVIRKEAPMTPARALALMDPVLSALGAAHRAGLVHRDVKPENILIADEAHGSRIKVADFGLAKAVSADTQHTATGGVLIGTVSYLAPELVVDGRSDARADVYAAGVVLYEMLTGQKPHAGESPIHVAYKHVHEDVPPPSAAAPGIPPYVDALVARATARDRSHRPADASVLLHQVHRVRQALEEGVGDDPELTADLAVAAPGPQTRLSLYDDEPEAAPGEAPEPEAQEERPSLLTQARPGPSDTFERVPMTEHTTTLRHPLPPPPAEDRVDEPRRRSRRGLVLFLVALLLAVGIGAGAWWFGVGRYTPTPSVIGLTAAAAEQKIEEAGLSFDTGSPAYSETVPKGQVISSDPAPGANVVDGGTVTVVLSLGKERYDVPRLRGLTEDQAQDRLTATKLAFGRSIERYHEDIPEGRVITSSPEAGTTLKPNTAVDLVLSLGPQPIQVRDFTGRDADRAEASLESQGLEVDIREEYSDDVRRGLVISQSPDSGELFKGDSVELVVSLGPDLVQVPNVIAYGVEEATRVLEQAGFEVEIRGDDEEVGLGFVIRTDPRAGEMARRGSTVTLTLI